MSNLTVKAKKKRSGKYFLVAPVTLRYYGYSNTTSVANWQLEVRHKPNQIVNGH